MHTIYIAVRTVRVLHTIGLINPNYCNDNDIIRTSVITEIKHFSFSEGWKPGQFIIEF